MPRRPVFSRVALLYACSFASGVAALAYEVAWTNLLSLSFGATRLAAGTVLAAFLGGMGLGAVAYPRLLARVHRPILAYGLLEAGIALTALPLTLVLPHLPAWIAPLADATGSGGAFTPIRFIVALLLLLAPCALMGATFPALAVALIRTPEGVGRHLGRLYGFNTLGAAGGALLSGVVLVEALGLRGSVLFGNGLNLAVAAIALRLARGETGPGDVPGGGVESAPAAAALPSSLPRAIAAVVLFGSGLATLGYEISWFRALSYLFGNSTYALTMMLFAFLVGLGLGPLFFRRVAARPRPERTLALCQIAIALLALGAITALVGAVESSALGERFSIFHRAVYDRPWPERLLRSAALALAVTLPATIAMGLSFPLAAALYVGDVRRLPQRLGVTVLLSNAGSIAGALGGALLLLPAFGTAGATKALAAVNLVLALLVLARSGGAPAFRLALGAASTAAAVAFILLGPDHFRFTVAAASAETPELLYEEEGDLATVQVWHDRSDPPRIGMAIDGTTIGCTRAWSSWTWTKQVLIAHLPFAIGGDRPDVLTVGLGSASTLEALLSHPDVRRVDCVEINVPVVRGARLFPEGRSMDDPRANVVVDDALHFLQRTKRRYDLIVSDGKQAMSFSGTGRLLSREYYELARERLGEGGLFVQWLPLAVGVEEFGMIVRTMGGVFPALEIYFEWPSHVIFVASSRAIGGGTGRGDPDPLMSHAARDLDLLDIPSAAALLDRRIAGREALLGAVGPGPVNTWNHPRLEFTSYKTRPARWPAEQAAILSILDRAARLEAESRTSEPSPRTRAYATLRAALAERLQGQEERASVLALRALAITPEDPAVRRWAAALGAPVAGGKTRERPGPG